jgi:hypothetical protein
MRRTVRRRRISQRRGPLVASRTRADNERGTAWPLAVAALWIVLGCALSALDSGFALVIQQQAQDELDSAARLALAGSLDLDVLVETGTTSVIDANAQGLLTSALAGRTHSSWHVRRAQIERRGGGYLAVAVIERSTTLTPWAHRTFTVTTPVRWEESP